MKVYFVALKLENKLDARNVPKRVWERKSPWMIFSNAWKSAKRSIKVGWNDQKIQESAQKLEVFRRVLTLSTILAFRVSRNNMPS